ncbi:MAG TPA: hypothetical protein PK252_09605 [Bacteroidales bacterium]|nr:hypothetical protein [Bacteroidales bacterium]
MISFLPIPSYIKNINKQVSIISAFLNVRPCCRILILSFFVLFVFSSFETKAQSSSKLAEFCAATAGDDATYLKDFVIELDAAGADGKSPEQMFTLLLSKNSEYRFTVCNAEGSAGKAIFQLHDISKLYVTSYNASTGQTYQSVNFQCQKTGAYHLKVSFLDGKKGSAVVVVSFIRTL